MLLLPLRFLFTRHIVRRSLQDRRGPAKLFRRKTSEIADAWFLQAGCPSCHSTKSVKVLKEVCWIVLW